MDDSTIRTLERIETKQQGIEQDIADIKNQIGTLNSYYLSLEGHKALVDRVCKLENEFDKLPTAKEFEVVKEKTDKQEGNTSKIAWFIILFVVGAVLTYVFKT